MLYSAKGDIYARFCVFYSINGQKYPSPSPKISPRSHFFCILILREHFGDLWGEQKESWESNWRRQKRSIYERATMLTVPEVFKCYEIEHSYAKKICHLNVLITCLDVGKSWCYYVSALGFFFIFIYYRYGEKLFVNHTLVAGRQSWTRVCGPARPHSVPIQGVCVILG